MLACFGHTPAPPAVVEGWRHVLAFAPGPRDAFRDLLAAAVSAPRDPRHGERIQAFCAEHHVPREVALSALHACEILLGQASALDLDRVPFGDDLTGLSGGRTDGSDVLLSVYDRVKREMRQQIIQGSLVDHGNVLVGLDWRLDRVMASDRGARMDTPVILLTLRYRTGERLERITLQLTPEALKDLRNFTERIGQ